MNVHVNSIKTDTPSELDLTMKHCFQLCHIRNERVHYEFE